MATYAAVVSLIHITENITTFRVRDPQFLVEQCVQLQSVHENVILLTEFLEDGSARGYNNEALENRILDAAYKAEDIIEAYIVEYLQAKRVEEDNGSEKNASDVGKMRSDRFSKELHKVLEDMYLVLKEVMEIKASSEFKVQKLAPVTKTRSTPPMVNTSTELFRDEANQIMYKLKSGQPNFRTCSIVGMGGTGKTTLAKKIYEDKNIVNHFDIRGWVTVSQEFNARELLVALLNETHAPCDKSLDYQQLGDVLYKHLFGRRYLIVMDDVWDIQALGKLKLFFPDNDNGSRVMVTTRMSTVSAHCSFNHKMNFLDEKQSWELLSEIVFGKSSCPAELKEVLEMTAQNCRGLLLSISVIGGLVASSDMALEYLEYIARATTTIVNSSDEDHCLDILSTSYNYLPVHLKPCFLYLGNFEEDAFIDTPELIRLWVSEGFLKPNKTKTLEEVAEDYLKDLIARNLVNVHNYLIEGDICYCKIHDLLRDLCLREARKRRFLYVTKCNNLVMSHGFNSYRRIAIHYSYEVKDSTQLDNSIWSSLSPRSLAFSRKVHLPQIFDVKLLRVLSGINYDSNEEDSFKLLNVRYTNSLKNVCKLFNSVHLFWNLQTLYCLDVSGDAALTAPSEIWEMPLLRHVEINRWYVSDPYVGACGNIVVLENLQTLLNVHDFRCTKEVVWKIPNIRNLGIVYSEAKMEFNLQNLAHLHKLESLFCLFRPRRDTMTRQFRLVLETLEFPVSLKKLEVSNFSFDWEEDVGRRFGSIPHLEILILWCKESSSEEEWNTAEGQFSSLKFLSLSNTHLVRWTTESAHFPHLRNLEISCSKKLEEIPLEIGDIPTLESIMVFSCNDSVDESARRILDEQRSYGNEDLKIQIHAKLKKNTRRTKKPPDMRILRYIFR